MGARFFNLFKSTARKVLFFAFLSIVRETNIKNGHIGGSLVLI